jgi:hypothetical protein
VVHLRTLLATHASIVADMRIATARCAAVFTKDDQRNSKAPGQTARLHACWHPIPISMTPLVPNAHQHDPALHAQWQQCRTVWHVISRLTQKPQCGLQGCFRVLSQPDAQPDQAADASPSFLTNSFLFVAHRMYMRSRYAPVLATTYDCASRNWSPPERYLLEHKLRRRFPEREVNDSSYLVQSPNWLRL